MRGLQVNGLTKSYGEKKALDDFSFQINQGENCWSCRKKWGRKNDTHKKDSRRTLARNDIHAEYMPQNYEDSLDLTKTPVTFFVSSR